MRLYIYKTCLYCNPAHFNVLPAILVTPKQSGFIIALKWCTGHAGIWITWYKWDKPRPSANERRNRLYYTMTGHTGERAVLLGKVEAKVWRSLWNR